MYNEYDCYAGSAFGMEGLVAEDKKVWRKQRPNGKRRGFLYVFRRKSVSPEPDVTLL